MPTYRATAPSATLLLASLLLSACGRDDATTRDGQVADAPLPAPQQAGGAVTDMPVRPGPGEVPLGGQAPTPAPVLLPADGRFGLPPLEENPETGLADTSATANALPPMPNDEDARQLLRDYYTRIRSGDFAGAQSAWAAAEAAAPSAAQLAAEFSGASTIDLRMGDPRPAEGAAGTIYIEVPATITTTLADGSVRQQAGRYTLRRSQVDGATPEQRAWKIAAVDLRDAAQ